MSYVQPKLNPVFARFKFNNEVQGVQTLEQFFTRLRTLAKDCNYGEEEDMIRDRIVFGVASPKIREKLINEGDKLTLDRAIQISQSHEYAQQQLKAMNGHVASGDIQAVSKRQMRPMSDDGPHTPYRQKAQN